MQDPCRQAQLCFQMTCLLFCAASPESYLCKSLNLVFTEIMTISSFWNLLHLRHRFKLNVSKTLSTGHAADALSAGRSACVAPREGGAVSDISYGVACCLNFSYAPLLGNVRVDIVGGLCLPNASLFWVTFMSFTQWQRIGCFALHCSKGTASGEGCYGAERTLAVHRMVPHFPVSLCDLFIVTM